MTEDNENVISPMALVRAALAMRLIDTKQREAIISDWSRNSSTPIAELMVNENYITEEQLSTLTTLLSLGFYADELMTSKKSQIVYKTYASDLYKSETDSKPHDAFAETKDDADFRSYYIKKNIGHGGLGLVNLYHDNALDRDVAIKEIRKELLEQNDLRQLMRFIQEARITGQLQHPAIVPIYELSIKPNGKPYFVMKYVQGLSMEDALKKTQSLESEDARFAARMKLLEPLISICEAIAYAHEKGVIHRDLKPANIIMGKFGETVILDWGLSKYVGQQEDRSVIPNRQEELIKTVSLNPTFIKDAELTHADELVGTPAYMAPEQVDDSYGNVDQRADVYALGVILFRILTGRMPYVAENIPALLDLIAKEDMPIPDPAKYYHKLPPELVVICRKAMSKQKSERFANALEMSEELEAYRDGRTVSIYEYTQKEILQRYLKRNRYALIAALLICVSILAATYEIKYYASLSSQTQKDALNAEQIAISEREKSKSAIVSAEETKKKFHEELRNISSKSDNLLKTVNTISGETEKYFADFAQSCATFNVNSIDLHDTQGTTTNSLVTYCQRIIRSYPSMMSCTIIDEHHNSIFTYPQDIPSSLPSWQEIDVNLAAGNSETPFIIPITNERNYAHYVYPLKSDKGKSGYFLVISFTPETIFSEAIKMKTEDGDFMWVMQSDGIILYDKDRTLVNANLLTDYRFKNNAELLTLGKRFPQEKIGIAQYNYYNPDGSVTDRQCAWHTIEMPNNVKWTIIVATNFKIE
ncbi:MAG: serine/threonine protein kinase [Candidatus Sumerlaeales bacterium]|nr:serine/threonine protein kinase [Candidatus Sumerlaeales bacterium]